MNLWLPEGKGGIVKEFGIDMYTVLYLKWITDKDLLYSQKKKRWHMIWKDSSLITFIIKNFKLEQ